MRNVHELTKEVLPWVTLMSDLVALTVPTEVMPVPTEVMPVPRTFPSPSSRVGPETSILACVPDAGTVGAKSTGNTPHSVHRCTPVVFSSEAAF